MWRTALRAAKATHEQTISRLRLRCRVMLVYSNTLEHEPAIHCWSQRDGLFEDCGRCISSRPAGGQKGTLGSTNHTDQWWGRLSD